MLMKNLETTNHSKHFLNQKLSDDMKQILFDVANESDFSIEFIEVDVDHIHILIRYIPRLSISSIANRLKAV